MAGLGQRFLNKGFKDIKPLIPIDGKPMVERVFRMFPEDSDFIFICNEQHLETTPLRNELKRIAPKALIIPIKPHKKGPVFSCFAGFESIDDEEEVFVNYIDLINVWDFNKFLKKVRQGGYDGAMPAFRGFHPASLGDTFYAYMRVNEKNEMMKIREKGSFTDNRMEEFASAGGYYFSKASLMKKYFKKVYDEELSTSGEYYASIPYNYMVDDGFSVLVYELEKHIVLGTPIDYYAYTFWSDFFRNRTLLRKEEKGFEIDCTTLVPLASKKGRFFFEGHPLPKPLIPLMKQPIFLTSLSCLPVNKDNLILLSLKEYIDEYNVDYLLKSQYPNAKVLQLREITEGMASTCLLAENHFDAEKPLMITGPNFVIEYDKKSLGQLLEDKNIDVIIFTHKNHNYERRNPYDHTYLKLDDKEEAVTFVSERVPISNEPYEDHAFVGAIFFRKGKFFLEGAKQMIRKEKRIDGQFLVATSVNELIKEGKKVVPFQVSKCISLGRDVNLKEFQYWEEYFSQLKEHPYQKQEGITI